MSLQPVTLRRLIAAIVASVAAAVVFLAFSITTTFAYWPWTVTTTYQTGTPYGFVVGASIADSLATAIDLQNAGILGNLSIFETDKTYHEQYNGDPATAADLPRLLGHNRWHIGLKKCNCWLLLDFHNGQLYQVTRKVYRGPTE